MLGAARYCSCGTRLAVDNRTGRCGACRRRDRDRFRRPPSVPAEFWEHEDLRSALTDRHFGRLPRAYRCHPFHGPRPLADDDMVALQSLRAADRQVGGGYLYATVTSYLQHTVAARLFGSTAEADERGAFVAAAGLTEMAGWMAHDAGRDSLAKQHFQRALGMAMYGRDRSDLPLASRTLV